MTNESFDLIQTGIASSDFILQSFVKGPGVDLRVYIIGKKIVGAIKRQANNSFGQIFLWVEVLRHTNAIKKFLIM